MRGGRALSKSAHLVPRFATTPTPTLPGTGWGYQHAPFFGFLGRTVHGSFFGAKAVHGSTQDGLGGGVGLGLLVKGLMDLFCDPFE